MDFEHELNQSVKRRAISQLAGESVSFHHWYRNKPQPNKVSLFIGVCIGFCIGLILSISVQ
ncbi:hypothetical protein Q4575_14680 [Psychrosphaera sp. 1_MG-2023]|uniref:hypothetical protein n=1 Tax=Psychrosphaera sp. 1_MG-2023 TaxID=3062643 RepID=UPI0026E374D1|nr:hypothetical protein [Psychrosphaera sp. 1_MG-2023]MDO6720656.1 hypothetical protein [Psychrosphaera sp. 1_MG-2023]